MSLIAKKSRYLLDPELAAVEQLPAISLTQETLAAVRAVREKQMEALMPSWPAFPDIDVSERYLPAGNAAPDVRVLVYRPTAADEVLPVLLWMHGGGYVGGSANWEGFLINPMVSAVNCCIVSVDYRLAPETSFPGPIDDCYTALKWLHDEASALRVDPERIAIGGISAGGGLAASLGLLARDRGEVAVKFQALLQPMLDDRHAAEDYEHPFAGEYLWRKEYNHFGWSALLGHEPGSNGVSPYAAAARAESLVGSPATFINVGAIDLFVEEDIEYARRLMRNGVPTELHVYPGACHGFQVLAPGSAVAKANDNDVFMALRRAFGVSAFPISEPSHDLR
jgi:acetyl esterase/lipase